MAAPIDSDFNFFFITILHKTYEFRLFLSDNTVLYGKLSFTLCDINLLRLKMCEKNVQMKIGMGLFHVYVQQMCQVQNINVHAPLDTNNNNIYHNNITFKC